MLLNLIWSLFGYKAAVSVRLLGFNKRPNYEVRISSKYLAEKLVNCYGVLPGNKSRSVRVPHVVKKQASSVKGAFLRGVIYGDGYVSANCVKIASGSGQFLSDVKNMLEKLGIKSGKIIKDSKTTNTMSLRITNKQGLHSLRSLYVGKYFYSRKRNALANFKNTV